MQSLLPPSLRLLVVGLNHKTAPLAVREQLAFAPADIPDLLTRFRETFPKAEVVLLSTCNRVELYVARPAADAPSIEQIASFLAQARKLQAADFVTHLYHRQDRAMVEHLFHVAGSLDSMVVGETQILAQVKHAYQLAADSGAVGSKHAHSSPEIAARHSIFHTLFQRALAGAKAVHEQTALASGRLSIASVAVDLARSVFDRFDDKTVLCIGAGKMSTLMLKHMADLHPKKIVIMNRSPERAAAVAVTLGASTAGMMDPQQLIDADIILTSTGATQPILTAAYFKTLLKPRRYRPAVIIDIAVPRDVEADVGTLNNVYLYNIDDLQQVASGNKQKRDAQIAQCKLLLEQHIEEFMTWFAGRDVGQLVKALYEHAHAVGRIELEAYIAAHPDLTEAHKKDLQRAIHRLVGKLLHTPVTQMTAGAQPDSRPALADALKQLFQLQTGESNSPPNGT